MNILVELVKLGAIGASLAFLILSFWLLKKEQERDQPRADFLSAIVKFRRAALTFFVVGALLEFFLSQGPLVLAAVNQSILQKDLERVRFAEWEYSPESRKIAFSFEENRADTAVFIPSAIKARYDVFIGIRKKDATASGQGKYDLVLGPYPISNQTNLEHVLTDAELTLLGAGCIQFTAFGILKPENGTTEIAKPFLPAVTPRTTVFNSATACLRQAGREQ